MSKYLPGLSYGMSGGPPPLSWSPRPTAAWIRENEHGEGFYTFKFWKGRETLKEVTFWSPSLRAAQAEAKAQNTEGSYESLLNYEMGERPY